MKKKRNDDKFPGYPQYPDSEDITRAKNNNGRERFEQEQSKSPQKDPATERDGATAIVRGTDADITEEDLRTLQATEQNMNTTDSLNLMNAALDSTDDDGDMLNEDGSLIMDMTGEGLDVPGSAADDADELIGEEDEENNYYSLGGDLHESQEENKGE